MVAVHRHHVLGLRQVQHQLQLLGIAVAGSVHRHVGGREDRRAQAVDAVDRLVDRPLVAGDRGGREDDGVALVQSDLRMVAVCHAAQGRQRLALAPCGDHHELVVREVLDLPGAHQHALGHVDMAEHAPDVHVLAHGAAEERDLAPELSGRVHHLLDSVDVGGEAGDDDAAPGSERRPRPAAVRPRRTRTARPPRGLRSSSRRRGAAGPRGRARRAAIRRPARRQPASGRTCSRP